MRQARWLLGIVAVLTAGCQPAARESSVNAGPRDPTRTTATAEPDAVVAYVAGQAVRRSDLWPGLAERAGAEQLREHVLDLLVARALAQRGLTITQQDLTDEQERARAALLADGPARSADEAQRYLDEIKRRQGLGETRWNALLRRNAGLRKLTADAPELARPLDDAALRRAFNQRFGPRYRLRLIVADTLPQAEQLRQRALNGEPFGELAAKQSTDASAAQGGLLSPMSLEDPTYPTALRTAAGRLEPGGVSPAIALEEGFALLSLEGVDPASPISFEEAREGVAADLRARLARQLMEQQARTLLDGAELLVLDRVLRGE